MLDRFKYLYNCNTTYLLPPDAVGRLLDVEGY